VETALPETKYPLRIATVTIASEVHIKSWGFIVFGRLSEWPFNFPTTLTIDP